LCCTINGTGVVVGYEGKGRRSRAGLWICWAQEERKKERKLGVRDVVDFFLHTKDWSLGAFFFFLGHRLSSGDAFDYSQLVEVMF